ncbi:hypothetical protein RUM43_010266 [Polyplax serrata]|uniref:Uncharacterized protein n=1 Tax=Polyplax serrata TaxID=468196 RepID=A0AAN8P3W1_POLSC
MEGPVLTSASSHRLRSAVSACAQSTHSYFTSSSYLGTRIQYGSHNSGGCIRKFHSFGKGGESRFFDKLNGTKKPDGNNETSVACKRRKLGDKSCLNHYCGFRIRPSAGKKKKTKEKNIRNGNEIENLSGTEFQGACDPGQFALKRNLIPKLTLNGTGAESKRLGQYLSGNQLNESNDKRCENLIATSGNNKITLFNGKRNKCNGRCIARDDSSSNNNNNNKSSNSTSGGNDGTNVIVDRNPNSKLLHYSSNKRGKVKTKNNKKNCVVSIFATKKVAANEDRIIDQCYKCDVRGYDVLELEDFRNENQEISKWLPKHVVTRRTAQIVR